MTNIKLIFAVALLVAVGSVGLASYGRDPGAVSDSQASRLIGGQCAYWDVGDCEGDPACSGDGFQPIGGPAYGVGQSSHACGVKACGYVADSVNGCGSPP